MQVEDLVASRLVFVTGKGGTGKTTFSVALASLAASQGKKTIIVEVDVHRPALADYYGVVPVYEPLSVTQNLDVSNITWIDALKDWLTGIVPAHRLVRVILSNRMVRLFLDATPGSRELVIFARILSLVQQYDLVVVDLPASGHALSFFLVPYRALSLFIAGPVRNLAAACVEEVKRPTTKIVLMSLPEEMVINETIETFLALKNLSPDLTPWLVVLNQAMNPTLSEGEKVLLSRLTMQIRSLSKKKDELERMREELVLAGRWEAEREEMTAETYERLKLKTGAFVMSLPLLATMDAPLDIARRVEAALRRFIVLSRPLEDATPTSERIADGGA